MALRCADAFRETAESFILGKFKSFPKGDLNAWGPILGDIAACATNLAFAPEIYLKCLRIQVGLPPRATTGDGHDLWCLFKPKLVYSKAQEGSNRRTSMAAAQRHGFRKSLFRHSLGYHQMSQIYTPGNDTGYTTVEPMCLPRSCERASSES